MSVKQLRLLPVLACLVGLGACGGSTSASSTGDAASSGTASAAAASSTTSSGHPSIIMLNELASDDFWRAAETGAAQAAKALGDPFSALDADGNATTQVSQIQAALVRHAKILIVAPVDSQTLAPYVKKAIDAGVKVCAVGIAEPYTYTDATVALEEEKGAAADATQILKWAKSAGKKSLNVLIAEIPQTQSPGPLRTGGFESVMKNPNPYGIKVHIVPKLFGTSLGTAASALSDALTANHIDAIYSETDFYSPPIQTVLKQHGYTPNTGSNHIYWVGTTATTSGISAIESGWEDYSQNDPVDAQAGTCVRLAAAAYAGQNVVSAVPAAARAEGLNPSQVLVTNDPKTGPSVQELFSAITRSNATSTAFWPNVLH